MTLPQDLYFEILSFVGYEEMVKMGFKDAILVLIFKRQFGHKSLIKYIKFHEEFYIPKNMMDVMRNKVNNFFRYCNFIIKEKFVKLKYVGWNDLSYNKCLTKEIIDAYFNEWNWYFLSRNTCLTKEIIDAYPNKWNWNNLSENECLTKEIIDAYPDKWNWYYLSENECLTKEIIDVYVNKWSWRKLLCNTCLTKEIIDVYKNKWY